LQPNVLIRDIPTESGLSCEGRASPDDGVKEHISGDKDDDDYIPRSGGKSPISFDTLPEYLPKKQVLILAQSAVATNSNAP
jgi:hypothetical protein